MCLFFRLSNSAHLKSYSTSFKKESCRWFQQLNAYESKAPSLLLAILALNADMKSSLQRLNFALNHH